MTDEEKFEYWKSFAERDLDAADAMYSTGRWFYAVFMCQQAVEKLVKGLYTLYVDANVPRIHNIKTLVERFEDKISVSVPIEYHDFFKRLSAYYIGNRYPDFASQTDEQITESETTDVFDKTKEVFKWLLTLKPQSL